VALLPSPPLDEYSNLSVNKTLSSYPELFEVVIPIKLPVLEQMMRSHPNQAFVKSILEGLQSGFWPWASTRKAGYPLMHDETKPVKLTEEKERFLEQEMGWLSVDFGEDLLPGMYCIACLCMWFQRLSQLIGNS